MPSNFWSYAMLIAAFIINRFPSALLNWKCPFPLSYGKDPDYERLKPFGCLAYAANVQSHKTKMIQGHQNQMPLEGDPHTIPVSGIRFKAESSYSLIQL